MRVTAAAAAEGGIIEKQETVCFIVLAATDATTPSIATLSKYHDIILSHTADMYFNSRRDTSHALRDGHSALTMTATRSHIHHRGQYTDISSLWFNSNSYLLD